MSDRGTTVIERPYFNEVIHSIDKDEFAIPKEYDSEYFPEFIARQLDKYVKYYEENRSLIFKWVPHLPDGFNWTNMLDGIKNLSEAIKEGVDLYFNGEIFKATHVFNNSLNFILFREF